MIIGTVIALMLLFMVVGAGWGFCGFDSPGRIDLLHFIFWAVFAGMCIFSLTTAMFIGLNLSVMKAWPAIFLLAGVGWIMKSRNHQEHHIKFNRRQLLDALILFFVLLGSSLGVSRNLIEFGMPMRIGPDAIGNVTAMAGLANGKTIDEISLKLEQSLNKAKLKDILSSKEKLLYTTPSVQTQIETEFLVAGLRWGFSGSGGLLLGTIQSQNRWLLINGLANTAILLTALGVVLILRKQETNFLVILFAALSTTVSPLILNSLREGGMAQIWVLPATVAILLLFYGERSKGKALPISLGVILSFVLVCYSDLFILLFVLLSFFWFLDNRKNMIEQDSKSFSFAALTFIALCLPFAIRFIGYIPRRLADASIGGWSMPHWTSVSESIGLVERYSMISPAGIAPRTPSMATNSIVLDTLIIALVLFSAKQAKQAKRSFHLFIGAFSLILLVRFKTEIIDQVTNYQYFKAWGCLMPFVIIGLVNLSFTEHLLVKRKLVFHLLSVSAVFMLILSSFTYSSKFRATSKFLDKEYETASFQERVSKLDEVSYFGPQSLEIMALASYTSGSWLGRWYFGKTEYLEGIRKNPVVMVFSKSSCPQWRCIEKISRELFLFQTDSLTAIKIGENLDFITTNNANEEWTKTVSKRLTEVGGPNLDINFNPVN